jgi:hypothetical protein
MDTRLKPSIDVSANRGLRKPLTTTLAVVDATLIRAYESAPICGLQSIQADRATLAPARG